MSIKLLIDPGHGGEDTGGGSNELFLEKNINLKISIYQFMRCLELGIMAAMTRTKDQTVPLYERSQKALEANAQYCFSNHVNWNFDPDKQGCLVIHSIFQDGTFATHVLNGIISAGQEKVGIWKRESKKYPGQDYYHMHRETGSTRTLIIEYAYASNENDSEDILQNWKQYAEGAIKGFCTFTKTEYKPPSKATDEYTKEIEREQYVVNVPISTEGNAKDLMEELQERGYLVYMDKRKFFNY